MTSDIVSPRCTRVRRVPRLCIGGMHWSIAATLSGQVANEMSSRVGLLSELTSGKRAMLRKFAFGNFGHCFSPLFFFF